MRKLPRKIIKCRGCQKDIEVSISSKKRFCCLQCYFNHGISQEHKDKISVKLKDKSWIDKYGEQKATKLKQNLSNQKLGNTLDNMWGCDKANKVKNRLSAMYKGISYEKRFGLEKANELKKKRKITSSYEKSLQHRMNLSKSHKDKIYPKDKYLTRGMSGKKFLLESRNKMSLSHKKFYQENPVYGEVHSLLMKTKWSDPKWRLFILDKIMSKILKIPSSFENKLIDLFKENNLPFRYVDNGSFFINNKNPDFICEKDNVVVEVFYSWFKIRDYGSIDNYKNFCLERYNKSNYNVIFLDENDILRSDWPVHCLQLINEKMNEEMMISETKKSIIKIMV